MAVVPCTNTPPVIGEVVFDPVEFVAAYPEFTGITNGAMTMNFARATLQLVAGCGSRVIDASQRQLLLYLLTAHITFLSNGSNDGAGNVTPPPGVVGRVSDAAEGTVSVSAAFDGPAAAQYYLQTKYGAEYWAATSRYRTMLYIPGPAIGYQGVANAGPWWGAPPSGGCGVC